MDIPFGFKTNLPILSSSWAEILGILEWKPTLRTKWARVILSPKLLSNTAHSLDVMVTVIRVLSLVSFYLEIRIGISSTFLFLTSQKVERRKIRDYSLNISVRSLFRLWTYLSILACCLFIITLTREKKTIQEPV